MPAEDIARLRTEFKRAEDFVQEVQGFRNEAGVPAINELRNAGNHLLKSIDDDGNVTPGEDLSSAIAHARRACYEASEAGIAFALAIIRKFREDYSTISVAPDLPGYTDDLVAAQAASKMLDSGREPGFDRAGDHSLRMEAFRALRLICERMDIAREELNKRLATYLAEQNTAADQARRNAADALVLKRRFIISCCLSVMAMIIAVSIAVIVYSLNH